MQFTILDLSVVVFYLIGIGVLGVWQARKIKSSGDFFAGGRKFNKFMMMMHSLGTGTHADDPVGVVGASYQRGLSGIWYTFVYLFATPFYWIIAPIFRRSRYLTTADFFEGRFGPSLGLLYTVMGVLTFTINMGILLKGTGLIASSVTQGLFPEWLAIVLMAAVFIAYGTCGGLIATVITESVQGLLIVVMSLLLIPFGLSLVGGFSGLHELVNPAMFNLQAPAELSLPWIVAASIASLIGIVAQPHTMEVCSTGKTEWEGRVGFTYGTFIKRFCALGWALAGVIVVAMAAQGIIEPLENREDAFGTAIRVLLPAGFTGLMLAAILAAQMSTLSAFMVAGSALLTRNIYYRYINTNASEHRQIQVGRIASIMIVLLGILFAFVVPGVAHALTIFWAVTTFTGVFMWAGFLWRGVNATGAWASFVVMVAIWLLLGPVGLALGKVFPDVEWFGLFGQKEHLHYLLVSYLPAGVVVLLGGSLLGSPTTKKKLDDFFALIRTPVGEEQKLIDQGVPIVYQGHSEGHPWEQKYFKRVNIIGFIVALVVSLAFIAILWLMGRIEG